MAIVRMFAVVCSMKILVIVAFGQIPQLLPYLPPESNILVPDPRNMKQLQACAKLVLVIASEFTEYPDPNPSSPEIDG